MGEQVYVYRSQQSVYDDGLREKPYGGDKLCRTVIYDKDGRQRTVTGCPPADSTTTTYVVKTDVTERRPAPSVFDYRRGSPAAVEQYGGYEVHRRSTSPTYGSDHHRRRPQEVDEFLTGVQVEASRNNNNNNFRAPAAKGHGGGGGYGDYRKGNSYGTGDYNSSDEEDSDEDQYESDVEVRRQYNSRPIAPAAAYGSGGRVSPVTHGVGNLSLPTNRIEEAVEYLTVKSNGSANSAKPAYGDVVGIPYGGDFQTTLNHPVKRDGEVVGSPYGGKFQTTLNHPVKRDGGATKKSTTYEETTKYHQYSAPEPLKPYATGTTDTKYHQSAAGNGYGTVNKTTAEVSKTYGTKYQQAPEPVKLYGTAAHNGGTGTATTTSSAASSVIDCYEAARKYNGKVIRT